MFQKLLNCHFSYGHGFGLGTCSRSALPEMPRRPVLEGDLLATAAAEGSRKKVLELFCVAEVAPQRAQELMLGVDTARGP